MCIPFIVPIGIVRDSFLACQEAEDTVLKIRPACFFWAHLAGIYKLALYRASDDRTK